MIKLEIGIRPKSHKYLEFSQSLESIQTDLMQLCAGLLITEKNKTFSLIAEMDSTEQLTEVLKSKELGILSGAIRMLAEKSEIIIHGNGHKIKGSDLQEIRLKFSKTKKEKTDY
jgi:hypothetical protein